MPKTQQKIDLEDQPLKQVQLSLETQVFLAFKHRIANRYHLLDKLVRFNIDLEKQRTDKTRYLSDKSKKFLKPILKKIVKQGYAVLNQKDIKSSTRCKERQNLNLLKQLGNLFEFKYHRKYLEYEYCYVFKLSSKIRKILERAAVKKGGTT